MSTTYIQFPNSNYPNYIDVPDNNDGNPVNANMAYRTDYSSYVKAIDFNTLRDAVLAIESVLGESPQGEHTTVRGYIEYLATYNEAHYDARYGGAGWSDLTEKPTLMGHIHSGKNGQPSQVDLTSQVTGKLPKASIQLDITNAGAHTAADIIVTGTTSVAKALDGKLNISGGVIKGNVTVQKNQSTDSAPTVANYGLTSFSSFFEAWTENMSVGNGGVSANMSDAWGGQAIKNLRRDVAPASATRLTLCTAGTDNLRYNRYSGLFRMYVLTLPSDLTTIMFQVEARDLGKGLQSKAITADDLEVGWNTVCLTFDHMQSTNNIVSLSVTYMSSIATDIYCDGITVVPSHTAIWG